MEYIVLSKGNEYINDVPGPGRYDPDYFSYKLPRRSKSPKDLSPLELERKMKHEYILNQLRDHKDLIGPGKYDHKSTVG